jgi:redox-sensing transcriptional repressor
MKPKESIPEQTLRRIPHYHQILTDLEAQGQKLISSRYLSRFFRVHDTQVRKDVSVIGYRGRPKAGYSVTGLKQAIADFLGINLRNTAVLIGAGKLGSALCGYPGLAEYGLRIVGVFDSDPSKIGTPVASFTIQAVESLPRFLSGQPIGIAILTVPKDAAQSAADLIVRLGIRAIWNFAPTQLAVPPEVSVRHENLAVGLALLSHDLKKSQQPAVAEMARDAV